MFLCWLQKQIHQSSWWFETDSHARRPQAIPVCCVARPSSMIMPLITSPGTCLDDTMRPDSSFDEHFLVRKLHSKKSVFFPAREVVQFHKYQDTLQEPAITRRPGCPQSKYQSRNRALIQWIAVSRSAVTRNCPLLISACNITYHKAGKRDPE